MMKGDSMAGIPSSALSLRNTYEHLPLVVSINCIEDCDIERESLAGIATFEHVSLSHLSDGRIESAAAVILHSLAYLPRAAQRRLSPWQLLLCVGSADRAVDSALAADLGLRLFHVDASRAEEIADTVMALFLGLVRRTHLLSRHSASNWLGSVQPLCRGMRRCRGLVLGIVGRSASARLLASRSLAFKMNVLYFDVEGGTRRVTRSSVAFPPYARRMDTLNDLLAASDLISIHCTLRNETVQIINAECLRHIKPGAFLVNIGSSQLLDDCAVKQLLVDGTLAGCALDGTDAPQWMEAWVKELPNVLIFPRGADYSEEVWMEIREKAIAILHAFFLDGVIPRDAISDEDENESHLSRDNEEKTCLLQCSPSKSLLDHAHVSRVSSQICHTHRGSDLTHNTPTQSQTKRVKSGKKARKRHSHQRLRRKSDERDDGTGTSGTEQVLSSSSCFASPGDSKSQKPQLEEGEESTSKELVISNIMISGNRQEMLKDGCIVALHARGHPHPALYVSRKRVKGGGWFLDALHNVTVRDPAAQFLVVSRNKDTIGLRSFTAGGKLLQINRRMEFVFTSHTFDAWESWLFEGSLEECRLVNYRNSSAVLEVGIEFLAAPDGDGVTRSLV